MRMWVTLPKPSPLETDTLKITVDDGTDPVSGATVVIGEDSETSSSDGVVEFELPYGDYTATVTATGYTDAEESISFRSNHKNFSISLTAATVESNTEET